MKEYHYKPKKDLTGQIFNHLTVEGLNQQLSDERHKGMWWVICDCENHTRFCVYGTNLIKNNTTKCKYCRAENLIGKKYNNLLVEKRIIDNNRIKWQCLCDCGNRTIVDRKSLISGHTKSCGCLLKKHASQLNALNLIGQRFGKLTVIERSNRLDGNGYHYWICNCDCGTKNKEINGRYLVNGRTQSCGCLRSHGEEKIAKLLTENNINFIREYAPKDCFLSSGKHPFFDFAILNSDKTIAYYIEYQGEQHYISRGNIYTPEKLEIIQERDRQKKDYCEAHNIPLIYIKYTEYNTFNLQDIYFPEYIH